MLPSKNFSDLGILEDLSLNICLMNNVEKILVVKIPVPIIEAATITAMSLATCAAPRYKVMIDYQNINIVNRPMSMTGSQNGNDLALQKAMGYPALKGAMTSMAGKMQRRKSRPH